MVGWKWKWNKWTETIYCKDQDDAEHAPQLEWVMKLAIRPLKVPSLVEELVTSPVLRQVLVSS